MSLGEKVIGAITVLVMLTVFGIDKVFVPVQALNEKLYRLEDRLQRIEDNQKVFMSQPPEKKK